jgi:hypothetical protein
MIDAAGAKDQSKAHTPPNPQTKLLSDEDVGLVQPSSGYSDVPPGYHVVNEQIDLQKLGCSAWPQTVTYGEVFSGKPPDAFSYAASFLPHLGLGLAITFGISLFVYGLVRAIGWVIGGFASS